MSKQLKYALIGVIGFAILLFITVGITTLVIEYPWVGGIIAGFFILICAWGIAGDIIESEKRRGER